MPYPTKRTRFGDVVLDVYEDVYEPAEDSYLFAENLRIKTGDLVLDMGTGTGILAVLAAKRDGVIIAVDLNPYATRSAHKNAKLNHVEHKIAFIQADLFAAFKAGISFDLILFNAPYLPSEEDESNTWIGRSWAGGTDGRQVVDRFINQAPQHLKLNGRILLMQSTLTGVQETIRRFSEKGLIAKVVAEQSLPFFETLTLIEAKRAQETIKVTTS